MRSFILFSLATAVVFGGCKKADAPAIASSVSQPVVETEKSEKPKMDHSKIKLGNGENNYIILDGVTRVESVLTFPKVAISQAGFLVLHPFKDGNPVQTVYVGSQAVNAGVNENVSVNVDSDLIAGDMFIVMLHYDMNTDGVFDFNDGVKVPDKPVFEGSTLVALRYQIP